MSGYQDTFNRASAAKELQKAAQRAVATRGLSYAGGPPTQERPFKNKYGKIETRTYETSGERNYKDYQNDKKNKSLSLQAKTAANQDSEAIENYRNYRKANNQYKGKYYGPDVFKGNMSLLKAWRKAGSPKDVKAFAKNNPNTGR